MNLKTDSWQALTLTCQRIIIITIGRPMVLTPTLRGMKPMMEAFNFSIEPQVVEALEAKEDLRINIEEIIRPIADKLAEMVNAIFFERF